MLPFFVAAVFAWNNAIFGACCDTRLRSAIGLRAATQGRPYAPIRRPPAAICAYLVRSRNEADSRKQGEAGGSVLKYVTDGDNAADDEDAHSGERKYAAGTVWARLGACHDTRLRLARYPDEGARGSYMKWC